jgi:hypothetical protein
MLYKHNICMTLALAWLTCFKEDAHWTVAADGGRMASTADLIVLRTC